MATLIYERALKINRDGNLVSYWEDHWPLQVVKETLLRNGSAFFAASYMNDPSALEGNSLKVAWLRYFLTEELEAARRIHNIERGTRHIGFDPTMGGESADPDFFGLFCIEMIDNKGYAIDYYEDRQPVDKQAQVAEDWADQWQPDRILLEDTAERGHAYVQFTTQINGGKGSKWPVEVRKPQSVRTEIGKKQRIQAMAARAQSGQIRFPGIVHPDTGQVVHDPRWDSFVNQWRTFPAGHDDLLDAWYWAAYDLFLDVEPAAGATTGQLPRPAGPDVSQSHQMPPRRFGRNRSDGRTGLVTDDGRDAAALATPSPGRLRLGLTRSLLTHGRDDDFFRR